MKNIYLLMVFIMGFIFGVALSMLNIKHANNINTPFGNYVCAEVVDIDEGIN